MSIIGSNILAGASGQAGGAYEIERSLRFNSADSAYLNRTPASAGNRKTWTLSLWLKRCGLGGLQAITSSADDAIWLFYNDSLGFYEGGGGFKRISTQVFRDTSAWYHFLLVVDTPNSTDQNRARAYVNGVEITSWITNNPITQNINTTWNAALPHQINGNNIIPFSNHYIAEFYNIDGQALTPSSFTEVSATTGQLIPKAYTGSYGTNGFRLDFSDNSAATATTLGKDYSGNSNNWTPNNLSVTAGAGNDSLVDTPTSYGTDTGAGGEVRGNYATWNPLDKSANVVLANGNLDMSQTDIGNVRATLGVSSGKWYWEIVAGSGNTVIGVSDSASLLDNYVGSNPKAVGWAQNGLFFVYGVTTVGGSAPTYTTGNVIGVALNMDAGTVQFYKNNSLISASASGLTGAWFPAIGTNVSATTSTTNFGQRPFAYTAPSGFKALCDTNLPAPVIAKPSTAMGVKLYTGNGSTQTISGLNFSPDLVWIKSRSGATDHALYDTVRTATKQLESNTTTAETTESTGLTAFATGGFSLGALAQVNTSSVTYAAWTWDAGSSTVTNTSGTISSQVRANVSAGFSVVTYTGTGANATVGHGLGIAPGMVIVKRRDTTANWQVRHTSIAAASSIQLNLTNAAASATTVWNSTAPSSTVFSVGTDATVNANTATYVAYCWAPVAGYSSFGSYAGNGSADGPFVYLGFRPAVVLVKMSSSTGNWTILDDKREGYNVDNDPLFPNLSNAEGTTDLIDITSNGFKVRTTDATFNTNAGTYVYAAWASSPFQYSRAR